MNNELRINSIESFSTKDGEGIRSVVFLQGCNLKCAYCHNPETWAMNGGEKMTADELAAKLLRFKDYWGTNGGVTISGGEPLLQAKQLIGLLELLKQHDVNIALETSGLPLNDDVRKVIGLCDHIIVDYKTKGQMLFFMNETEKLKKRVWVRIVIVPGVNDTDKAIDEYAMFFKGWKIEKTELVPFHTLGFDKYKKLGIENPLEGTKPMSVSRVRELQRRFDSIAK